MKNTFQSCPLCSKQVGGELSERHCKLCAMQLDKEQKEFCSRKCRKQYKEFRK